jgi:branched-chain amino acid transport system permease protein
MSNKKIIGLGIVIAIFLACVPLMVKSPYYMSILIMAGLNAILAMTFIMMLRTGLISLSIAAFWGMGAYASTMLVMKLHVSFWLALPASIIIVGIVALFIGFLFVRNAGFGFIMLTAVLGMLIVVVFGNTPLLGGYTGIQSIPPPNPVNIPFFPSIEFASKTPFYYMILIFVTLVIAVFSAFYTAWTGRAWMAIGLNRRLAESLGVNVFRYRLLAFVVASATAALAGSFYAHYIGAVIPDTFGIFKTIYVHIYAIFGGVGFAILGPVVGSFVMTFVPELLRVTKTIEPIITGAILILTILLLPKGILSLWTLRRSALCRGEGTVRTDNNKKIESPLRFKEKSEGNVLLQVRELSKHFGGLVALDKLDIDIIDSEVLGVIGPNGAGKTTLLNVISGFFPATDGKVVFDSMDITMLKAHQVAQIGISRTFQASTLFMNLSVLDNVFIGYHMRYETDIWKRLLRTPAALKEEKTLKLRAEEILEFMGLAPLKGELAKNLPYGHQKVLSVCVALATSPKLLLLDEPVTGMNPIEIQTMMNIIRRIRDSGITITIVEHNMKTVVNLCDRLIVLNYGQKIAEGLPVAILENEEVIEAYLGEKEAEGDVA